MKVKLSWSQRDHYIISMGYLRKLRLNQKSEPLHLYTYEPLFPEILDPPLICQYGRLLEIFAHMRYVTRQCFRYSPKDEGSCL